MKQAAHLSAAAEILHTAFEHWHGGGDLPLDVQLSKYTKSRRYMGSKDRRAVADYVYGTMRDWGRLTWWQTHAGLTPSALLAVLMHAAKTQSLEAILAMCNGEGHAPNTLDDGEQQCLKAAYESGFSHDEMPFYAQANMPEWLWEKWQAQYGKDALVEAQSYHVPAPVCLRVNTLKSTREKILHALSNAGIKAAPARYAAHGIELSARFPSDAPWLKSGELEIQEEASQLVAQLMDVQPGQHVLDMCAGAGGKTLALAAAMQNKGEILACDVSPKRLAELEKRAARAGVSIIRTQLIAEDALEEVSAMTGRFDHVLIDAPCSGTGTWRRNPEVMWRITPDNLLKYNAIQERLLEQATPLVKAGGVLTYVTCSALAEENEQRIENYRAKKPHMMLAPRSKLWDISEQENRSPSSALIALTPRQYATDGFFISQLR